MPAQINLLDEIIIDNFAGGGGASTGDISGVLGNFRFDQCDV